MTKPGTYYHVTTADNLESIQATGLEPRLGERAQKWEDEKGVWLYEDLETTDDALTNWIGDDLPDDQDVAILEITLDETQRDNLIQKEDEFDLWYDGVIPPSAIKVHSIDPAVTPPKP